MSFETIGRDTPRPLVVVRQLSEPRNEWTNHARVCGKKALGKTLLHVNGTLHYSGVCSCIDCEIVHPMGDLDRRGRCSKCAAERKPFFRTRTLASAQVVEGMAR